MNDAVRSALLFGVSCVVSGLVLEQGFRIHLFGARAFDRELLRNNVPIYNAGIAEPSPLPGVIWRLRPDLDTSFKLARLHTNGAGLADREYPLVKPAGTTRIAVLGDSYSMASGVDTDQSYHALMEARFASVELVNFAVGGFGLEQYNATLEHLAPRWHPDAVLLGYCGHNDHQPSPEGLLPSGFAPPRLDGFRISYVREALRLHARSSAADARPPGEDAFAFVDRELSRTRELADRLAPGMPILLVFLDNRAHPDAELARLAEIATRHRIAFVDTSHAFAGAPLDDYSLDPLDSHPNAAAHRRFAEILYSALRERGWPAGAPSAPTR